MNGNFYSINDVYLMHHGIKGQRWGIRRFVDENGDLTPEGKKRYRTANDARDAYTNKKNLRFRQKLWNAGTNAVTGGLMLQAINSKADNFTAVNLAPTVHSRHKAYVNPEDMRKDLKRDTHGKQFIKNVTKSVLATTAKTAALSAVTSAAATKAHGQKKLRLVISPSIYTGPTYSKRTKRDGPAPRVRRYNVFLR